MMTKTFSASVTQTGEGDLAAFRDATLAYCAALRAKQPFHCQTSPESAELLSWLGVEWEESEVETKSSNGNFPSTQLADFRSEGYLGVTLFAALVRSSYGPDEPGYFPTQSELGFYYDDENLRSDVRWDHDYLTECQEFFFEEQTPAELMEQSLALIGTPLNEEFQDELLGVVFLVGEQETMLKPVADFLKRLLTPTGCGEQLQALRTSGWAELKSEHKERLEQDFFGPFSHQAGDIVAALGEAFLSWRASL